MKWAIGMLLILAGISWFVVSAAAASMASRATTRKENLLPFLGLTLVGIGVVIIIWG